MKQNLQYHILHVAISRNYVTKSFKHFFLHHESDSWFDVLLQNELTVTRLEAMAYGFNGGTPKTFAWGRGRSRLYRWVCEQWEVAQGPAHFQEPRPMQRTGELFASPFLLFAGSLYEIGKWGPSIEDLSRFRCPWKRGVLCHRHVWTLGFRLRYPASVFHTGPPPHKEYTRAWERDTRPNRKEQDTVD